MREEDCDEEECVEREDEEEIECVWTGGGGGTTGRVEIRGA